MSEGIAACLSFVISLSAIVLSLRSFREKGFLFNNAYLFASKKERAEMNRKPYFRQTAVIFLLLGIIFLLLGFAVLLDAVWLSHIAQAFIIITLIYAIASSAVLEKGKHKT